MPQTLTVELAPVGTTASASVGTVNGSSAPESVDLVDTNVLAIGNLAPLLCIIPDSSAMMKWDLTDVIPGNSTVLACRFKYQTTGIVITNGTPGVVRVGAMNRYGTWDSPQNVGFEYATTNLDLLYPTEFSVDTIIPTRLIKDQFMGKFSYLAGATIPDLDTFIRDESYVPADGVVLDFQTDPIAAEVRRVLGDYLTNNVMAVVWEGFELPEGVVEEIRIKDGSSNNGPTLFIQYSIPDGVGVGEMEITERSVASSASAGPRCSSMAAVAERSSAIAFADSRVECRAAIEQRVRVTRVEIGQSS